MFRAHIIKSNAITRLARPQKKWLPASKYLEKANIFTAIGQYHFQAYAPCRPASPLH